jgi:hypothetical protein
MKLTMSLPNSILRSPRISGHTGNEGRRGILKSEQGIKKKQRNCGLWKIVNSTNTD